MKNKKVLLLCFCLFFILGSVFIVLLKDKYLAALDTKSVIHDTKSIQLDTFINLINTNNVIFDYNNNEFQKKNLLSISNELNSKNTVIFHFWASWCEPCINEIPDLIHFLNLNSHLISSNELKIVFISQDYEYESLKKFIVSFPNIDSPSYIRIWDKNSVVSKEFGIDRLPATIIFNKQQINKKFFGVVDWKNLKLDN